MERIGCDLHLIDLEGVDHDGTFFDWDLKEAENGVGDHESTDYQVDELEPRAPVAAKHLLFFLLRLLLLFVFSHYFGSVYKLL